MSGTGNPYCAALGISAPRLADAARSPDANHYSLLLVALLEHGAPMTLAEVAARFQDAGLAWADDALASLKRCKPARAPIYRDGDRYALDPHDEDSSRFWRRGAIIVRSDGLWELDRGRDAVRSTRQCVRDRISDLRRWAANRPDPEALKAHQARIESKRTGHGQQLTRLRRVLLHAFPASKPQAIVLHVADRAIETYIGEEFAHAVARLASYEIIGAVSVRGLLRSLNVDARHHRLAELGPPQKTRQLNRRGRTLAITMPLLVQGSCGISRPFGDPGTLREYLRAGAETKLRRRLEADMKSLFALDQYGRVHGAVRLRWGFLDEMLPAPWVHRDEPTLHDLLTTAYQRGVPLDVVIGSAPGWADPWVRARRAYPAADAWGWPSRLVDEDGYEIPRAEVQLARLAAGHGESTP